VNLDGTDAAGQFTLPRVEIQSGARGWTCVCHLPNGTSRERPLSAATVPAAKRAALAEASIALGERYEQELRALLA
jgi:hypothetical protein